MIARRCLAALALAVLLLPGPVRAEEAMQIQEVTSPGGITAWLVQDDSLPLVAVAWSFEGGVALDPEGKAGTVSMATALLTEGAGSRDAVAFQEALENNSISLSFSAGRDAIFGSLKFISDRQDLAIELANAAMTDPLMEEAAIERVRARTIAGIRSARSSPSWVAARAQNRILFEGHPYAEPGGGSEDSVAAITREDLIAVPETRFGRDVLQVAVAGDIGPEALGRLLDELFAGVAAEAAPFSIPDIAPQAGGTTTVIPFPGPQTQIRMAQAGIPREDPDWYAAELVNYILGGGGFASRLMQEVREARGLTYGVYSDLSSLEHASLLSVGGSTAHENAAEAMAVIRAEWARMAEDGPTAEELDAAKTYLIGSFALGLSSTDRIAGIALSIQRDGLGRDYPQRRAALFDQVALADAQEVAARLLQPDALAVILVGAPEGVEADRERAPESL